MSIPNASRQVRVQCCSCKPIHCDGARSNGHNDFPEFVIQLQVSELDVLKKKINLYDHSIENLYFFDLYLIYILIHSMEERTKIAVPILPHQAESRPNQKQLVDISQCLRFYICVIGHNLVVECMCRHRDAWSLSECVCGFFIVCRNSIDFFFVYAMYTNAAYHELEYFLPAHELGSRRASAYIFLCRLIYLSLVRLYLFCICLSVSARRLSLLFCEH